MGLGESHVSGARSRPALAPDGRATRGPAALEDDQAASCDVPPQPAPTTSCSGTTINNGRDRIPVTDPLHRGSLARLTTPLDREDAELRHRRSWRQRPPQRRHQPRRAPSLSPLPSAAAGARPQQRVLRRPGPSRPRQTRRCRRAARRRQAVASARFARWAILPQVPTQRSAHALAPP